MTRRSISITFETMTPESAEQGDFANHGWVAPNETEVSLCCDCRGRSLQDVARKPRIKRAQQGKFDWTLRDAVRFMLDKRLGSMWFSGAQDDSLNVITQEDQDEYHPGNSQRWSMHVRASQGTLDRLARVLKGQGARADWEDRFPRGWEAISA